jgi:phosphoheptose isomerase
MKRKIAMISEHASPLAVLGGVDSGGQNVYVAQTALHLADMGHQVDVFTRKDNPDLPEIYEWEKGIRVIHVPAGPETYVRKEGLLPYMSDFAGYMQEFILNQTEPYHLIHAHFWMSGLVAKELKAALNIPFVITFHALGRVRRKYQGQSDGFPDERFEIEEQIVDAADRIIAECPQDQEDLIDLYCANPDKIVIVPCGFDSDEVTPIDKREARKYLGLPEDEKLVLQLGRMVPRKGVDTVVRAMGRLIYSYEIPARLLVVGGDSDIPDKKITPELGRLEEIARDEEVLDYVTFTGRRSRSILRYYYSAADVFVSTPWYEPFGITPVEAMAAGTPVIGSNVGGIKYTVANGETGFLIEPNDPDALADRLAYLFRNPQVIEQFSRNAIERANNLFTWERVSRTLANVYQQVSGDSDLNRPERQSQVALVRKGFQEAVRAMERSQDQLVESILDAAQMIVSALSAGSKVMVCGNGGSAADSQHFAGELVGRFKKPGRAGLPVLSLTADSSFLTAWANDYAYEDVFARQVKAFGQPGDILIGISTSGQSMNVIEAFKAAREMNLQTIGLLGGDGGLVKPLADLAVIVPATDKARIQEVQIFVLHTLAELIENQVLSADPVAVPDTEVNPAEMDWGLRLNLVADSLHQPFDSKNKTKTNGRNTWKA